MGVEMQLQEERAISFRLSHRLKICSLMCAVENEKINDATRLRLSRQLQKAREEFEQLYGEII